MENPHDLSTGITPCVFPPWGVGDSPLDRSSQSSCMHNPRLNEAVLAPERPSHLGLLTESADGALARPTTTI